MHFPTRKTIAAGFIIAVLLRDQCRFTNRNKDIYKEILGTLHPRLAYYI
jgi:hypothetical protein